MKKLLSALIITLFSVSSLFAYSPTPKDTAIIQQINTIMDGMSQEQLNPVKEMLVNLQMKFEKDSKKYRLAEQFIQHIEQLWAWRSLQTTFADTSEKAIEQAELIADLPAVKNWDSITVHYKGTLTDGTLFDTSLEDVARAYETYDSRRAYEPLPFTVWAKQMIAWFDAGVVGMKVWEKKTLTIAPKDAYGETGSHSLAWETLIFEVTLVEIKE